jgi:hypothetical protein
MPTWKTPAQANPPLKPGLSPTSPTPTPGANPGPYSPPDQSDNAEHILRPRDDQELQKISKGE